MSQSGGDKNTQETFHSKLSLFTLEERAELPHGHRPLGAELAGPHLKQEDRQPHQHQGDDIGDEEGSWRLG